MTICLAPGGHWVVSKAADSGRDTLVKRFGSLVFMQIHVLFFGMLKDMAGRPSDFIDLPEGARLQELVDYYERQIPQIRQWMPVLALSVNRQYASRQHFLHAGDEVALLPPVSGGSDAGDPMADSRCDVRLVREPIQTADVLGEPIVNVNSLHHQGLKYIPAGLRIAGYAPDGLVEAIELTNHPFGIAVQWHPEWLTDQQSTRNLFRRFVESAGSNG